MEIEKIRACYPQKNLALLEQAESELCSFLIGRGMSESDTKMACYWLEKVMNNYLLTYLLDIKEEYENGGNILKGIRRKK